MQQIESFNFEDFGNTFGNAVQDVVSGFGNNSEASGLQSLAIAGLTKAQADAIKSNAENKKQITRNIFVLLVVAILAVTVIALVKNIWK